MPIWRRMGSHTAIFVIAVLLGVRFIGAVHAAEYGDPYHTHQGEPCVINALLESAPADLSAAPCVARQFSAQAADIPETRVVTARATRRAHAIRAPPELSIRPA
jgi:hypothetical protein